LATCNPCETRPWLAPCQRLSSLAIWICHLWGNAAGAALFGRAPKPHKPLSWTSALSAARHSGL
jgi:hypothetical protein